jgi:hypothetical protein
VHDFGEVVWCERDDTPGALSGVIVRAYENDARYIAAASPDVILALLDEIAALRAVFPVKNAV